MLRRGGGIPHNLARGGRRATARRPWFPRSLLERDQKRRVQRLDHREPDAGEKGEERDCEDSNGHPEALDIQPISLEAKGLQKLLSSKCTLQS